MGDGLMAAVGTLAVMGLVLCLVAFAALRNLLTELVDGLGCVPEESEAERLQREFPPGPMVEIIRAYSPGRVTW